MRNLFLVLSAALIVGLAFWAYRENYRTQGEVAELRALQNEIGQLKEGLGVLDAEWAYLNRPDRLRELADANFARLKLLPLAPEQFGDVAQVPYPSVTTPDPAATPGAATDGSADPAAPALTAEAAPPPPAEPAKPAKKPASKKPAKKPADAAPVDPILAATIAALENTP